MKKINDTEHCLFTFLPFSHLQLIGWHKARWAGPRAVSVREGGIRDTVLKHSQAQVRCLRAGEVLDKRFVRAGEVFRRAREVFRA